MKRTIKNRQGDMKIELTSQEWDIMQSVMVKAKKRGALDHEREVLFCDLIIETPACNYYNFKNFVK